MKKILFISSSIFLFILGMAFFILGVGMVRVEFHEELIIAPYFAMIGGFSCMILGIVDIIAYRSFSNLESRVLTLENEINVILKDEQSSPKKPNKIYSKDYILSDTNKVETRLENKITKYNKKVKLCKFCNQQMPAESNQCPVCFNSQE